MQLSASTKINDLLSTYPFLEDFFVGYNPHFSMLKNKIARATVFRVATLGAAARIAGVDIHALLRDLAAAVSRRRALMSTPAMRAAAPKVATRPTVARAILFLSMAKCGL